MITIHCVLHTTVLADIIKSISVACAEVDASDANSSKLPMVVHVFIHRTCSRWQMLLRLVSFIHDFRLARTLGLRTEKRISSFVSEQKLNCEHVDHSKNCRARPLGFRYRKASRAMGFRKEIVFQACSFCLKTNGSTTISVQNRSVRRHGCIAT